MASYPSTPVVFPARSDGQTIYSAHVNALQDEIAALETALLASGLAHDLKALQSLTLPGILAAPALAVDANDYAPPGLANAYTLRLSSSAAVNISGIVAQPNGRVLNIVNVGGFAITLLQGSGLSAAANRLFLPGGTRALATGDSITLWYDAISSLWRTLGDATPLVSGSAPTEGTANLTLVGSTSGAGTASSNFCQWTRIGNRLTIDCLLVVATVGTIAGTVCIGGLPLPSKNSTQSTFAVYYAGLNTAVAGLMAFLPITGSALQLSKVPAAGAVGHTALLPGDIAVGTVFRVSGSYMV